MIYAKPGDNAQQFGGTCPDGWVQMQSERPEGDYIASETGEWVVKSLTKTEQIDLELKSYNIDIQTLRNQLSGIDLEAPTNIEDRKAKVRASMVSRKAAYLAKINLIKNGG